MPQRPPKTIPTCIIIWSSTQDLLAQETIIIFNIHSHLQHPQLLLHKDSKTLEQLTPSRYNSFNETRYNSFNETIGMLIYIHLWNHFTMHFDNNVCSNHWIFLVQIVISFSSHSLLTSYILTPYNILAPNFTYKQISQEDCDCLSTIQTSDLTTVLLCHKSCRCKAYIILHYIITASIAV